MLLSTTKNLGSVPPDSAEYIDNKMMGTQESLQTQVLVQSAGAEEQKNVASSTSTANKEVKELRDQSKEQLQIT